MTRATHLHPSPSHLLSRRRRRGLGSVGARERHGQARLGAGLLHTCSSTSPSSAAEDACVSITTGCCRSILSAVLSGHSLNPQNSC